MKTIRVQLHIRRASGWQNYDVDVPPDGYVMDALEAAGSQDQSLLYRHSCHHASCGSCGLRLNGREALPCITPLSQFKAAIPHLRLEPLRNFPIIGDLLVDFGPFMRKLDSIDMPLMRNAESFAEPAHDKGIPTRLQSAEGPGTSTALSNFSRFENCIECGLCVSACPVAGRDPLYAGPAMLAAAGRVVSEPRQRDIGKMIARINEEHGLWRCHAAFECSEVCPANVDPAREIMNLRSKILRSSSRTRIEGSA